MARIDKSLNNSVEQRKLVCENLSFAASEAYKLLRANLTFALADKNKTPVVGITSATRGEAKTTTAINLAYTVAETGKKVLLIDGDMRLPNVARVLQMEKSPGLSNVIAGLNSINEAIRETEAQNKWYVLPAGDVPPNPSELLNSEGFINFIATVRADYDYIIFDLPPVGIVSDALVAAQTIDGLIVVTRQDYSSRKGLDQCITQLAPLKEKVLGIVMTDATKNDKGRYYGKNKYRSYSKYYESGYGYGYGYYGKSKSRSKKRKGETKTETKVETKTEAEK